MNSKLWNSNVSIVLCKKSWQFPDNDSMEAIASCALNRGCIREEQFEQIYISILFLRFSFFNQSESRRMYKWISIVKLILSWTMLDHLDSTRICEPLCLDIKDIPKVAMGFWELISIQEIDIFLLFIQI